MAIPSATHDGAPTLTQILVQNIFICKSCSKLHAAEPNVDKDGVPTIILTPENDGTCNCNKRKTTLSKTTQTDFINTPSQTITITPIPPFPTNQPVNVRNQLVNPLSDPFVHTLPCKPEWFPDQQHGHDTSKSNTSTDENNNNGTYPYFDPFTTDRDLFDIPEWHSMLNDFNLLNPDPFEQLDNLEKQTPPSASSTYIPQHINNNSIQQ